ncbi:MAG: carbohydrate ABC transporter permease [Firmicutes bacterium]|nr:carbohydrate ABC transporter permease [Bacillota bacterium]
MKIKISPQQRFFDVFNVIFTFFLMVIMLYPMVHVVMASFSEGERLLTHTGLLLWPKGFNLLAYERALGNPSILNGYKTSLFILIVGCAINILLSTFGAYFLTLKDVMWKKPISFFIVFTMFFSGGLIPLYLTVNNIGLMNSLWAVILVGAISTYNMIILRTGLDAIPKSLQESAVIDGAGHLTVLFRIMVPLALPSLAVVLLYYGVGHWNAWFNASIFLNDSKKYPLQLVLRGILLINDTATMTQGVSNTETWAAGEAVKYAVIVIATLPILCAYPFLQKYFVKGVMIGAVKG